MFFVIGAQKAGTTWLSRYFRDHPNVSVPLWKEHNYWNMVEGSLTSGRMLEAQSDRRKRDGVLRRIGRSLEFTNYGRRQKSITLALKASEAAHAPHSAYADVLLQNAGSATGAMGELCPQYALLNSQTFAEMNGLTDNVRFIYILRDPLSRFLSGVQHNMRKSSGSTDVTIEKLSEQVNNFAKNPASGPIRRSRYDQTIAQLEEHVPQEQIMYVFFENLFEQTQVQKICDFLNVPFVPAAVSRKRNVAGKSAVAVSDLDRSVAARPLKPVYEFALERFGTDLPKKWMTNATLSGAIVEEMVG
ncbi:MAG: sulfotransferase [Roseobacter sp.]